MNRKIGSILLSLLLVILMTDWIIGVKKVNSESYIPVKYIELNESLYYGEVSYTAKKLSLYNNEEFKKVFGVDLTQSVFGGDMFIVLELFVKNESDSDMDLSQMLFEVGWGFESHTWYSSTDPFICAEINKFDSDTVSSGEEICFYAVTTVNKICFSDEGWEQLYNTDFYYTMSVYPEPVKFNLGKPERLTE